MGDVIQLPTAPRAPYLLLAWDQFVNTCRLDYIHRSGAREHIGSGKDYLSVRNAARECAHDFRLPLVDKIDPTLMPRAGAR